MSTDRWEEMVALFERALDHPTRDRDRFVTAEATDPDLREKVLAMLRADGNPHPILDATGGGTGAFESDAPARLAGRDIGGYAVIREIGRGATATVCLARDPKHRREVALKLLDAHASSVLGGDRFRREIEVVARLQHPHILPLHDSGEADGLLYYVMPVVQGESLRQRIEREGPLPVALVRRIVHEVGSALDYAHRQGVIHRDVKPANILLDDEHAVIADFGIARRVIDDRTAEITGAGVPIGTPAYMSPEQVRGVVELDARSDVYAFGCVAFAMLAGHQPFQGATSAALLGQHLYAPVPSVRAARPELPPEVDAVLGRALAKNASDRYGSMHELVDALDQALADPAPRPRRQWARWAGVAAAVIVAVTAALAWRAGRREATPPSIAVLPFADLGGDSTNAYFSNGMTEELIGSLAQLGRIRVTPSTTVFAYKGRTGDIRRIGAELGVSRVLEGSVRRDSDRVLVQASLYDASTGDRLWTDRYERSWGSMLAIQSDIAGAIAEQLRLTLLPGERARMARRLTVNADAYDSYLRGRYFFDIRTNAAMHQAVTHFQRALGFDSSYARAYAGLADSYSIMAWTGGGPPDSLYGLARRAAERAMAIDSLLPDAWVSVGIIETFNGWDWEAASRATARAVALDSTLAAAWFYHTWPQVALGRFDQALGAIARARELEPLSLINNARLATVLVWSDRLVTADSVLRRTLEIDPSYPVARVQRARVLSLLGRHEEAIAALPPDSVRLGSFEAGIPGFVHARAGRVAEALALARALEARDYPPAEAIAAVFVGLGDTETALTWVQRAVETRATSVVFLGAEPMFAPLRVIPRFRRILERVGVTIRA